jgi:hypothetical protein
MKGMGRRDTVIWDIVACHIDRAEKRLVLGYLARTPFRLASARELAASCPGDQLTLLQLLADLQEAGLVERLVAPAGVRYRLARRDGLPELIRSLPDYYEDAAARR